MTAAAAATGRPAPGVPRGSPAERACSYFGRLGPLVDDLWRRSHRDVEAFPEAAVAALAELPPHAFLRPLDAAEWALATPTLPPQSLHAFGQPPVEVFRGERFYVQVLYWLDGTTSIHQHGFAGAFALLEGSSIHAEYAFGLRERINAQLRLGDIDLRRIELLGQGVVRPIPPGEGLIHALFHLDHPSVTVVVRTDGKEAGPPQYNYLRPCVSIDPFDRNDRLERRLGLARMLASLGDPASEAPLQEFVRQADLYTLLKALSLFYGDPRYDPDLVFRLFAGALSRRRPFVGSLLQVLEEQRRERSVSALRRDVKRPDHRFLLAVLLNAPDRASALSLVRAYDPGAAPEDLVARWVGELAALPELAGRLPGVDWTRGGLAALKALLRGQPPRAAEAEAIRRADLFRPILA